MGLPRQHHSYVLGLIGAQGAGAIVVTSLEYGLIYDYLPNVLHYNSTVIISDAYVVHSRRSCDDPGVWTLAELYCEGPHENMKRPRFAV